jgi:hypothetical protein
MHHLKATLEQLQSEIEIKHVIIADLRYNANLLTLNGKAGIFNHRTRLSHVNNLVRSKVQVSFENLADRESTSSKRLFITT